MNEIKIYQTGKMGVKGEVVFPQKLREFMKISTGNEIAFKTAEKKGDEYIIKVEVVR
ncbi:MAG: hypothetical protein J7K95_02260 [Thermoplasmata archaeon]|nr:hypothetical protein [Thermoplasmata archaeon]